MGKNTGNSAQVTGGNRKQAALDISEMMWGYTIRQGGAAQTRANVGELLAIVGCLFFGAAAFGQWLIPESQIGSDVVMIKISGTIMLFVFSALLYLIARRGLTVEAQVDTKRETLKLVRRNREGGTTPLSTIRFADIGSVYIKRSKSIGAPVQMFMRPGSGAAPVLIASGRVRELEPLLHRIQMDTGGQLAAAPTARPQPRKSVDRPRPRSAFAAG